MTRLHPKLFELQQLACICRYCGAPAGVWCTGPRDEWSHFMHSDRFYQVHPRWRVTGTDFPRDAKAEERLAQSIRDAEVHSRGA